MESNLTNNQAYDAMLHFLDKMHNEFGWESLGALLGSMALIDGVPLDVAMANDWTQAIELATRDANHEAHGLLWTKDQAYLATLHFLDQMFDSKREDIGALIRDMTLLDGKPRDPTLIEPWKRAVEFVDRGGKPDPYVLVKDGIPYEVRRGASEPKKD
jgi:hypothetical protein